MVGQHLGGLQNVFSELICAREAVDQLVCVLGTGHSVHQAGNQLSSDEFSRHGAHCLGLTEIGDLAA